MDRPLVLRSSLLRWWLAATTPVLLLGVGGFALTRGVAVAPVAVTVLGLGAAAVVVWDVPLRVEFTRDGITRVCLLRRDVLPWTEVVAVERLATGIRQRRAAQADGPGATRAPRQSQGLVARVGPRRTVLLVDRRESHAEHAELRRLLTDRATVLRASAPPVDAAPAGRGPDALHRR